MITFVVPIYALVLTRNLQRLVRISAGLALGAAMAAIFIIPYLFERDYLKPLGAKTEIQSYKAGFLLEDLSSAFAQIPLPSSGNFYLFVSASNWMALGFVLLIAASSWVIWKSEFRHNALIRAVWAITAFSFLMTTRVSMPLWALVPKFKAIQFPVRWFVIVSVGASLLAGVAISRLAGRKKSYYLQACALASAIVFNLAVSGLVVARAPFQPEEIQKKFQYYTDVREYHPKWWDQQRHAELDASPAAVDSGSARISAIDETGTVQSYAVDADTESVLRFRTLYFPGWTARIDGRSAPVSPGRDGHIRLEVGPGEHTLKLALEDTRPRAAGKMISGLSLLAFVAILFVIRRAALAARQEALSQDRPPEKATRPPERKQSQNRLRSKS
jgi:hypothetical protein